MSQPPWEQSPAEALGLGNHRQAQPPPELRPRGDGRLPRAQLAASTVVVVALALFLLGRAFAGRPPPTFEPELMQPPAQTETDASPFTFDYRGTTYVVQPVADYELWGLVMSHNNIASIADSYHDGSSVDTKDLCVVWGANLGDDLRRISVRNSSWTCWVRWPAGVQFHGDALSNNHLVTDDPAIRRAIGRVRRGDQLRLKGMLVNYHPQEHPSWIRSTSTTRTDDGNTACEVVFVQELQWLRRGTPVAYALRDGSWGALLAGLAAKVGLFLWGVWRQARE